MFAKFNTSIAFSLAALTLGTAFASTPAAACWAGAPGCGTPYWPLYMRHHGWPGPDFRRIVGPDFAPYCGYRVVYDRYGDRQVINECY